MHLPRIKKSIIIITIMIIIIIIIIIKIIIIITATTTTKTNLKKNRKRDDPRIETCRTPYFNVPASKKTLSIQTKNFLFKRYESNHLITDVRKASISFFQGELLGLKYQMLSEDLLTSYRYASAYPYQLRQSLSTELDKVY